MILLGDIHGEFANLIQLLEYQDEMVIQLGDLGLGFKQLIFNKETTERTMFSYDVNKFRFIRGNHDRPMSCWGHPNYLGDYGIFDNMFFISGAFSIDKGSRTEGVDWWPEEELSYSEGLKVIELYEKIKPSIVISHDCPFEILRHFHPIVFTIKTRTGQLMDLLLDIHKPKFWYFAHHHRSFNSNIEGTNFICLNTLEMKRIQN